MTSYDVVDLIKKSMKNVYLKGYEGKEWVNSKSIKKDVEKNKINTTDLQYSVKEAPFGVPVYFYKDYMLFKGNKIEYDDILIAGTIYDFKKAKYKNDFYFFYTRNNKCYSSDVSFSTGRLICNFVENLLKSKGVDAQYYLDILKGLDEFGTDKNAFKNTKHIRYECIKKAYDLEPDNQEVCRIKALYDTILEFMADAGKISDILHSSKTFEKQIEAIKDIIEKSRKKFQNAEKFDWLVGYQYRDFCLQTLCLLVMCANKRLEFKYCEEYTKHCTEMLDKIQNNRLVKNIEISSFDVEDFLCSTAKLFFKNPQLQNYELSARFIDAALQLKDIQMSTYYGDITYILSNFYRYGLGGKEKSEEESRKWLIESANRGNGDAFYRLYTISKDEFNEREAANWEKKYKEYEKKNKKKISKDSIEKEEAYINVRDKAADVLGMVEKGGVTFVNVASSIKAGTGDMSEGLGTIVSMINNAAAKMTRSKTEKLEEEGKLENERRNQELDRKNFEIASSDVDTKAIKQDIKHDKWLERKARIEKKK